MTPMGTYVNPILDQFWSWELSESAPRPLAGLSHGGKRSIVDSVTRLTSFDTRCPVLRRSGCFRPSDRLAGWDSHPLEIADFHGVLGC